MTRVSLSIQTLADADMRRRPLTRRIVADDVPAAAFNNGFKVQVVIMSVIFNLILLTIYLLIVSGCRVSFDINQCDQQG